MNQLVEKAATLIAKNPKLSSGVSSSEMFVYGLLGTPCSKDEEKLARTPSEAITRLCLRDGYIPDCQKTTCYKIG